MLWIEMKPAVLANDVLFDTFIDKVAEYTVQALVGVAELAANESGEYSASISVGVGAGDAEGTYGVMFDASYIKDDEHRGPAKASERYGVTFWNFTTAKRAIEFAEKFGRALARDEKDYSVVVIDRGIEEGNSTTN